MELKYIIVEDESLSAQMLESIVEELRPNWINLGIFDSVTETVDWLSENKQPDLIFLDIQLSDGLSFSIFDKVKITSAVIFTTAYDEHAIKAFKLNSVDYLLKPIKEKSLQEAIEKLESILAIMDKKEIDYKTIVQSLSIDKKDYRKRFLVSRRDEMYTLPIEEVAYIYFENKITYAVNFEGKSWAINFTLDKLEEELNPSVFIRANRQVIVNLNAIASLENYFGGKLIVKLLPELDFKMVVSRAKASSFKEWLDS